MPAVLLAGAFGQRNPGDEALLSAFRAALDGWDVVVASSNPALTEAVHGCEAVASGSAVCVAKALRRVDAVVFGGGTVFKTLPPSTGRRPNDLLLKGVLLAEAARRMRRPVALVGVGAGALPGRQAQALARRLAGRADLLVVRDEESARALSSAGVRHPVSVGADVAWSLPHERQPSLGDTVLVSLSRYAGDAALVDRLAAALTGVHDRGMPLALWPWQVGGPGLDDLDLARALLARLAARGVHDIPVLLPPADLTEAERQLRQARLVVGLRFHSLVAAAGAGVPFVAVAHEAKLAAAARRLGQPAVPTDDQAALTDGVANALDAPPPEPAAVAVQVAGAHDTLGRMRDLLRSWAVRR